MRCQFMVFKVLLFNKTTNPLRCRCFSRAQSHTIVGSVHTSQTCAVASARQTAYANLEGYIIKTGLVPLSYYIVASSVVSSNFPVPSTNYSSQIDSNAVLTVDPLLCRVR